MAASDGGHVWPPRSSDLRIQELTGAGIQASKPGDVFAALRTAGYVGSLDDMWKQHKVALGITDTSEPFTDSIAAGGGGGGGAVGSDIDLFDPNATIFFSTVPILSHGFWMSADGTRVFHCSDTGDIVTSLTLSTPYDITSSVYDGSPTADLGRPMDVWLNADMSILWTITAGTNTVTAYTLSTPGDLSTISAAVATLSMTGITSGHGLYVNPDGDKVYASGNGLVIQANLSTAWDLTTGSVVDSFDVKTEVPGAGSGYAMTLDPSGTRLYVADLTDEDCAQYNLSTAWDLTTAAYSGNAIVLSGFALSPHGMFMHPDGDGTTIYGIGQGGADKMYMLELL